MIMITQIKITPRQDDSEEEQIRKLQEYLDFRTLVI